MQSDQMTIYEMFFGPEIFKIPKYQRAFAWEERQLSDFVDDLDNQNLEKDYFFGTILFELQGEEGDFKIIDIVGGQHFTRESIRDRDCEFIDTFYDTSKQGNGAD